MHDLDGLDPRRRRVLVPTGQEHPGDRPEAEQNVSTIFSQWTSASFDYCEQKVVRGRALSGQQTDRLNLIKTNKKKLLIRLLI